MTRDEPRGHRLVIVDEQHSRLSGAEVGDKDAESVTLENLSTECVGIDSMGRVTSPGEILVADRIVP